MDAAANLSKNGTLKVFTEQVVDLKVLDLAVSQRLSFPTVGLNAGVVVVPGRTVQLHQKLAVIQAGFAEHDLVNPSLKGGKFIVGQQFAQDQIPILFIFGPCFVAD